MSRLKYWDNVAGAWKPVAPTAEEHSTHVNSIVMPEDNIHGLQSNRVSIGANAETIGVDSIAVGLNAKSGSIEDPEGTPIEHGLNSIAIGKGSQTYADNTISIGADSYAGYTAQGSTGHSIMIGHSTGGGDLNTIGIGDGIECYGEDSIVIGHGARSWGAGIVLGTDSRMDGSGIMIGKDLFTSDSNVTLVGDGTDGGNNCFAGGYNAKAEGRDTVTIGANSVSNPHSGSEEGKNVIVGAETSVTGNNNVALGHGISIIQTGDLDSDNSIAIGYQSVVSAPNSGTAVGQSTEAKGEGSTVLGENSKALANYSVAVGTWTLAGSDRDGTIEGWASVAIGSEAQAFDGAGIAIGDQAKCGSIYDNYGTMDTGGFKAIAIGYMAKTPYDYGIAMGAETESRYASISIGRSSTSLSADSISIGVSAQSPEYSSIAIGTSALANDSYAIAIGSGSNADNTAGISMGDNSNADGIGSIAIGGESSTATNYDISIGYLANTTGGGDISIGYNTSSGAAGAIAIGSGAQADKENCIAIGDSAVISGPDSFDKDNIAIGRSTSITDSAESIVIGAGASAIDSYSVALGSWSECGMYGLAIGKNSDATGQNSTALGTGAEATAEYSAAIGANAAAVNVDEGVLGVATNSNGPNSWVVPGNFSVTGSKNFQISHPHPDKKETHDLRHSAVESPHAQNLYRFTTEATLDNQTITIELPDYFEHLNSDTDVWVNPDEHFGRAYGKVVGNTLTVTCEKAGKYKCLVIGTRSDDASYLGDVEKEKGMNWDGTTRVLVVDEITNINEIEEV